MADELIDRLKGAAESGARKNSEDELAEAFVNEHGEAILFDHDRGRWRRWNGTRWWEDEMGAVMGDIRHTCRRHAEGEKPGEQRRLRSRKTITNVDGLARNDQRVACTSELFDKDPMLLGTPGGTVDLQTGQTRAADPGDFITKCTGVTPAARADCSRWNSFLAEATGDDAELSSFLQRVCGYVLTGKTIEHALFFAFGSGGNGKSVFLNTVAGVMGDYAADAAMDTFVDTRSDQHPTGIAALRGARLVSATETEAGRHWAESRIKKITGGDPITARFMRGDFFTYTPQFKAVIAGNHQPQLRNVDDAIRRRLHMLPFVHKPRVVDRELSERLREEWPAILRWMIDGTLAWQRDGLQPPHVVEAATASYFDAQDLVGEFIGQHCERGPGHACGVQTLFKYWRDFMEGRGEQPGTMKGFVSAISAYGIERRKKKSGKVWVGIAPKTGALAQDEDE